MERLVLLASALEVAVGQLRGVDSVGAHSQSLEWLLDLTNSSGSFRNQTTGIANWQAVRNIVLLDATNPRSLRFQVDGVRQALQRLGQDASVSVVGLEQTAQQLATWDTEGVPELAQLALAFAQLRIEIAALSDLLAARYFSVSEPGMTV